MAQRIIHTRHPAEALDEICTALKPDNIIAVADVNTAPMARALNLPVVEIGAGEEHKTIESVDLLWSEFHSAGLTRHSVVVNVGGGMITDLGGFAAATYRRGIPFINIPTTLLGAVDAACGGKTGFNHCGVKNHIGAFAPAQGVIVNVEYFKTLPVSELLSGYAEMLKHALIDGFEETVRTLLFDPAEPDWKALAPLVERNIEIKRGITDIDPYEKGLRKALNLGHTAGHAFEAHAIEQGRAIPHGYAVAYGLVVALVLSVMKKGADSAVLHTVAERVRSLYGAPDIDCSHYDRLLALMLDDKKNRHDSMVRFTLLEAPGLPAVDCPVDDPTVRAALDIARDLFAI